MEDRIAKGRAFLEAKRPGMFRELVNQAMDFGGVVHLAPECVLIGFPCADAPRTLLVSFQCSQLCALCKLLLGLSDRYDRVRWTRGFRGQGAVKERDIKDFARHLGLGYAISKP